MLIHRNALAESLLSLGVCKMLRDWLVVIYIFLKHRFEEKNKMLHGMEGPNMGL